MIIVPTTDIRYCLRTRQLNKTTYPYESVLLYHGAPWGPLGREQWFLKYWLGEDDGKSFLFLVPSYDSFHAYTDAFPATQERILTKEWISTPVLAPSFKNLVKAHIITAEFDLERDEGEYYGQLMQKAGNEVTVKRYPGVPHAFGHFNHPERGLSQSFVYIESFGRCTLGRMKSNGEYVRRIDGAKKIFLLKL